MKKIIITVVILAVLAAAVFAGWMYMDIKNSERPAKYADVLSYDLDVELDSLKISGQLADEKLGAKELSFTDDEGKIDIKLTLCKKYFGVKNTFSGEYKSSWPVKTVTLEGFVIWDNGFSITEKTAGIFEAAHSHIGDGPGNEKLLEALGFTDELGAYTQRVNTSQEPYVWTLTLKKEFTDAECTPILDETFRYYATMLIAAVDDLDTVSIEFPCEGEMRSYQLGAEGADEHYGSSVKDAGSTPFGLEQLRLSFNR